MDTPLLHEVLETTSVGNQYYNIGSDFIALKNAMEASNNKLIDQYQKIIGSKLNGKRVFARASKGYKQFLKDYEFNISTITIENYYGDYVVIAHDKTSGKPKEYFLNSKYSIKIIGPIQIPQKKQPIAKSQPIQPHNPPIQAPLKEEDHLFDAYSVDSIADDIKEWMPTILKKPETPLRDVIPKLGWQKTINDNTTVSIFDLKLPGNLIKDNIKKQDLYTLINQQNNNNHTYEITKFTPNKEKGVWEIRVKKTMYSGK